jgi:long-chain acyl-CoA synthetase
MTLSLFERLGIAALRRETLGGVMERMAKIHGGRRLVHEHASGRELTYADCAKSVRVWANAIAAEIEPGEPVVIATPNGYDQFLLCLAASRAGGLPAPVNDQMRDAEVEHVIADSGARLVIRSAGDLSRSSPESEPVLPPAADVAALFYTSGTTGKPKGAALTHRALVGQLSGAALWPTGIRRDEVVAGLPVAHIMGFAAYLGLALAGLPTYCFERFRPLEVLEVIERRRVTGFVGVPAMYQMLLEAGAARYDLTSVRIWMSGADVMPAHVLRQFKRFGAAAHVPVLGPVGDATFVEGYGMVEVGGGVMAKISPPAMSLGAGDSLGFRLPGNRFRVVDGDGEPVGVGNVGELWVKGPGVLQGYWNAPEATREAVTDDGWLKTGDLVRLGPFGTVLFHGRRKTVIKSGGYSVYPLEVEATLVEHPEVIEAAVIGVPDAKLGEVPVAAVRLREGSVVRADAIIDWGAERLAHFKAPRQIRIVDELPRTGTAKIQKDRLYELFDSGTS